jgi:hydrogenase maturation protease
MAGPGAGPEATGGPELIVGYGNPLRTDDGAGPAVAERLALDPRLAGADVRTAHQLTPELALDASGASLLVLIDAADGPQPGSVAVRRLEGSRGQEEGGSGVPGASEPPMTHHVDPDALLGLAAVLFGAAPPAVIISIGASSFEVGEGLTPDVLAGVDRAVELVASIVEAHRGV